VGRADRARSVGVTNVLTVDGGDFATYRTAGGKPFRNLLPLRRG